MLGLFLLHINYCRLFNAKSIFIHINMFCFTAYQPFSGHLTTSWFSNIQISISRFILFTQLNVKIVQLNIKIVLFQTTQFSIRTQFCSIWSLERILSCATTPGLSGPGSDGNEGILRIHQSFSITGTSPVNLKAMERRGTPYFPKIQHYWNFSYLIV